MRCLSKKITNRFDDIQQLKDMPQRLRPDALKTYLLKHLTTTRTLTAFLHQMARNRSGLSIPIGRKYQPRFETQYGITSLSPEVEEDLLKLRREHWTIENKVHWVRDTVLGEDASQARTGSIPQVIAALRNTAMSVLRRTHKNL